MRKVVPLVAGVVVWALAGAITAGVGAGATSATPALAHDQSGPRVAAAVAGQAACKPGLRKVGGAQVQFYCGPAKATATFRGRSVSFRNGMCTRAAKAWAINVGSATIPPAKPRYSYFGITMGKLRGDRTYRNVSVGFQWRGKTYTVVSNAVTVKGKGTRGTFTGRLDDPSGPKVAGSFAC